MSATIKQHYPEWTHSWYCFTCLFFQCGYPETDGDRAKAKLSNRARGTGRSLDNIEWNVGWASVAMGKTKTRAMTVLAKPEDHSLLMKALMWVTEAKSQMYPITQHWVVSPVVASTVWGGPPYCTSYEDQRWIYQAQDICRYHRSDTREGPFLHSPRKNILHRGTHSPKRKDEGTTILGRVGSSVWNILSGTMEKISFLGVTPVISTYILC